MGLIHDFCKYTLQCAKLVQLLTFCPPHATNCVNPHPARTLSTGLLMSVDGQKGQN